MLKLVLRLLTLLSGLLTHTLQKIVISGYKQQVVLIDQVPIVNTAMTIKNDGTKNIQDYQMILPSEKISLIGHIDVEDGFGQQVTHEITNSDMTLDIKGVSKQFTFLNFVLKEPLGPTREIQVNMRIYYYGKYQFIPEYTDLFVSLCFG